MAIIYDINYMKKCDKKFEEYIKIAEESRDYHNKLLDYKPKGIIEKIQRAFWIRFLKFANNFSINCAEYCIRRKMTAVMKGAPNVKTNSK